MCLATVYKESDDTVICRNVSKILVEGEKVIIRDIMGEETSIEGKILMVDLANSIVTVKKLSSYDRFYTDKAELNNKKLSERIRKCHM